MLPFRTIGSQPTDTNGRSRSVSLSASLAADVRLCPAPLEARQAHKSSTSSGERTYGRTVTLLGATRYLIFCKQRESVQRVRCVAKMADAAVASSSRPLVAWLRRRGCLFSRVLGCSSRLVVVACGWVAMLTSHTIAQRSPLSRKQFRSYRSSQSTIRFE